MEFRCCFCSAIEEEAPLIELSSNLLVIENTHYEFTRVFAELLGLTHNDLRTNFVCDACKDQTIQFFVFKNSVENQVNRHRKMILTQVQDFLSQCANLEDIQVVRKLSSITLQIDDSGSSNKVENVSNEAEIVRSEPEEITELELELDECNFEDVISVSDGVAESFSGDVEELESIKEVELEKLCSKCDSSVENSDQLDVHEFLKHSLLGDYIEGDFQRENLVTALDDAGNVVKICAVCSYEVEESAFNLHLVSKHAKEIIPTINEQFEIDEAAIITDFITSYIDHIQNLATGSSSSIDEDLRKYFYSVYSNDPSEIQVQAVVVSSDDESAHETIEKPSEFKSTKSPKHRVTLSHEDRTWLRKETNLRKNIVLNSSGAERTVYKCAYCIKHVSNSPAGFRYHLVNIHLKDTRIEDLQEVASDVPIELKPEKTRRNTCDDCNLKMREHKQFSAHMTCHRLFGNIARDYSFPACNTCNKMFIDEASLDLHLANHRSGNLISLPVSVPTGAVALAGKPVGTNRPARNEQIDGFQWSCGHCTEEFAKEVPCRLHLMMFHVSTFNCPIDKREFSGVKAASLFCHHLQNKHPDHFPEVTFACTLCKTEFPTIYEKLAHMKNCDSKKFVCDHCPKRFFKKSELIAHVRFVSGEVNFPCNVCDKKCETMSDLKIHLRSHTKEKPFECPLCMKKFRTLAARSAHCDSHNRPDVHSCFCGKSFRQRQLYRRHVKAFHEKDGNSSNNWIQQADASS